MLQDLIPPSYLDELSLLQDQIAPFSSELAFDMIERELNIPLDELFSEISPEPTAAASLGQVFLSITVVVLFSGYVHGLRVKVQYDHL